MKLEKTIAAWMVAEGCNQTTEGNWVFYHSEVEKLFGLSHESLIEIAPKIVDEIYHFEAVADVECLERANERFKYPYFDICFYLGYCGLGE